MDPMAAQTVLLFREAWEHNSRRMREAVRTAPGDSARLSRVHEQGLDFLRRIPSMVPPVNAHEAQTAMLTMENLLDDVEDAFLDPDTTVNAIAMPAQWVSTGGRPRLEIARQFLESALRLGSVSKIARFLGVTRRTVRARLLDLGMVERGEPVVTEETDDRGEVYEVYHQPERAMCTWTNAELDARVREILQSQPKWGRPMIMGHFRWQGIRISEERVEYSLKRVAPQRGFGERYVDERRIYRVAGPNSMWHIDAQLGLVRYGIVIHGIIDGYSRLVTGLGVHTNNRKATFFTLFKRACHEWGIPSRTRGDHGVENLDIAEFMEGVRGGNHGSFIWGRSVHNIRIERLWVDVTKAFGFKWKQFFILLETWCGLDLRNRDHLWLLQYLFLHEIRRDAQVFQNTWNMHEMILPDMPKDTPAAMWYFGSIKNGLRGIVEDDRAWYAPEVEGGGQMYGVDWAELQRDDIMQQFYGRQPPTFSEVRVEDTISPLNDHELAALRHGLQDVPGWETDLGKLVTRWERGLDVYRGVVAGGLAL